MDSNYENPPTVTEELEIKTEITVDKSSEGTTPETIVSELLVEAVNEVVPSEIDWVSYPYNSGDRYTLENRANKVKSRILACATTYFSRDLWFAGDIREPIFYFF